MKNVYCVFVEIKGGVSGVGPDYPMLKHICESEAAAVAIRDRLQSENDTSDMYAYAITFFTVQKWEVKPASIAAQT